MDVSIVLPAMAASPNPLPTGDVGFVYGGGWAQLSTALWGQPIDVGFQYSTKFNHYVFFLGGGNHTPVIGDSYVAGQTVNLLVEATGTNQLGVVTAQASGFVDNGGCAPGVYCVQAMSDEVGLGGAGRWGPDNIVFKKLVSVGQSFGNNFADGAMFGPFTWEPCSSDPNCQEGPEVGVGNEMTQDNGVAPWVPWSAGGYQSWPDDSSSPNPRVIVQFVSPNVETDTIYLHP